MHHLTIFSLLLLTLMQRLHADQYDAEDCREYCLQCGTDKTNYITPNATLHDALEVSLQVLASGLLPNAQISLSTSSPHISIVVNQENVTLRRDGSKHDTLTLTRSHPAFSWVTLILAPSGHNTLLVYTPEDRINVITANTNPGLHVFVTSNKETHVVFNCLSGCLIRDSTSALVDEIGQLQPPFTMYLKPHPSLSINITLALSPKTSKHEPNETKLNTDEFKEDTWHRVIFLVAKQQQQEPKEGKLQEGKDGIMEMQMWLTNGTYTLTQVLGCNWTLYCAPKGLLNTTIFPSLDLGNTTERIYASTPATEGTGGVGEGGGGEEDDKSKEEKKGGRAGAGEVTAWLLAGLALFLVMVLALALCTKTAQHSKPYHVQDSQPSVGTVYFKGAKEPEEDSEPESPNELKVPTNRNSYRYFAKEYKVVEG